MKLLICLICPAFMLASTVPVTGNGMFGYSDGTDWFSVEFAGPGITADVQPWSCSSNQCRVFGLFNGEWQGALMDLVDPNPFVELGQTVTDLSFELELGMKVVTASAPGYVDDWVQPFTLVDPPDDPPALVAGDAMAPEPSEWMLVGFGVLLLWKCKHGDRAA